MKVHNEELSRLCLIELLAKARISSIYGDFYKDNTK
jgi:hypothetical protein